MLVLFSKTKISYHPTSSSCSVSPTLSQRSYSSLTSNSSPILSQRSYSNSSNSSDSSSVSPTLQNIVKINFNQIKPYRLSSFGEAVKFATTHLE